ncbi:hypothetical protein Btru_054368 [Bulinus truncatus]|nr:hypothetical protein Btru_054368 [Bulinus truncatus]
MTFKNSRDHSIEYLQREEPHCYEFSVNTYVRVVDNVLGDLARHLIICDTLESNVDNQCDILSPVSFYKKIVCRALSSEVLSQPSSLELLHAHHRGRDKFRISSFLMATDSVMDTVKRAHSFKRLSRIVGWFSLPSNLLNFILVVLSVFLTYITCWTSLWLDSDTESNLFYFLIHSFLLMAFVFQPGLILIFAFLLSDRWPPHKREAEDRAKGIRTSIQFRLKLLASDKLQTSSACSSRHWTFSTEYITLIRAKCRTCSATIKDEHQHKRSYESNIHRVVAIILIMFLLITFKNGNVDCRFKQTEFLKGILKIQELQQNTTITIDDVWDTLTTTFYYGLRNNLANINTTSSFYTVSAMRVRQFRVVPNKRRLGGSLEMRQISMKWPTLHDVAHST